MRPTRRPLDFPDFDAFLADVERLRAAGYTPVGGWNLPQACDHLAKFMNASIDGFGFRFPWYMRLGAPLVLRYTLKSRRIPAGIKGPPSMVPRPDAREDDAVESLRQATARVRDHAGDFQPSPLFGPVPPDTWRQLHLIHAAHHLSFLVPKADAAGAA